MIVGATSYIARREAALRSGYLAKLAHVLTIDKIVGIRTTRNKSMTAYVIANLDVTDPAVFSDYGEQVVPLIKKFGGRYLVRGGDVESLEGSPDSNV